MSGRGHKHTGSLVQNQKAHLANAYNELGKELSSSKIRVVGNYTLGKVIGEGAYGKVRMGVHRLTSVRVAIKQIPKAMSASLTREIHHHRTLHHPHVTQMYEVIATENSIWIVTELCSGGELFDYLVEKGRIPEDEAKIIFGQLCLAVGYLHDKGIVHRDLKLENVLLDERCRVKLGDFGFTREFEKGALMETFCGTTGYASPEMLQGRKYLGPEVDIWSLGIILYCLLTGTLPFDDDDEDVMRKKIIIGEFEDPEWLSTESRDLIKNIIQQDPTKRLPISQILTHAWFTAPTPSVRADTADSTTTDASDTNSESNRLFATDNDVYSSTPTTPDEPEFKLDDKGPAIHRTPSELTIRKADLETLHTKLSAPATHPGTVPEEDDAELSPSAPPRMLSSLSISSKGPPPPVTRTPARTKRRSVSSIQNSDPAASDPDAGDETVEILTPDFSASAGASDSLAQSGGAHAMNFASLLSSPAPVIFSTPLERELLNTLSGLGFDIAQIVHSVLSDACDAAGAVWWMLKRKAEKRAMEQQRALSTSPAAVDGKREEYMTEDEVLAAVESERGHGQKQRNVGVQTEPAYSHLILESRSAIPGLPQLSFVPPTPTVSAGRPVTPPRPESVARPMLSPVPSTTTGESSTSRSHPGTPASSVKDREGGSALSTGSKGRKGRSGSVSIMQRATTALEAAGLVRKKSSEAFKDKEKEEKAAPERKGSAGEETRSSHGSGSYGPATASKLTKSPPLRPSKDHKDKDVPSTPPPSEDLHHPQPVMVARLAVAVESRPRTRSADARELAWGYGWGRTRFSVYAELWYRGGDGEGELGITPPSREPADGFPTVVQRGSEGKAQAGAGVDYNRCFDSGAVWDSDGGQVAEADAVQPQSVDAAGVQLDVGEAKDERVEWRREVRLQLEGAPAAGVGVLKALEQRQFAAVVDYVGADDRPRFAGTGARAAVVREPHAEFGAGGTLVATVVDPELLDAAAAPKIAFGELLGVGKHANDVAHREVPPPPREWVLDEGREACADNDDDYEQQAATARAFKFRRIVDAFPCVVAPDVFLRAAAAAAIELGRGGLPHWLTFQIELAAQFARKGVLAGRVHAGRVHDHNDKHDIHRAKANRRVRVAELYGLHRAYELEEVSRTAHLPIEVLAISPISDVTTIRDVFSGTGRAGLGLGAVGVGSTGDESDWVDEDDDIPAFAGGLGQMATSMAGSSTSHHPPSAIETVTLSPAPRGHRPSKRANRSGSGSSASSSGGGGGARQGSKAGHSPSVSSTPLPPENSLYESAGRRQLPPGRSGQAFRQPIQEEDEGEEE
ncbi:Serine/threonine-protein kinase MARK2 [Mycena venus]|uniref:Serine/threonine-protein kinase MARK2 n=1 Tax=Mycena venus TaxID=2733690 RepID=A0A8H7DDM0_9AGAR|nr:Serine/threonine-protein kinase MARK2 [Mycena venus]